MNHHKKRKWRTHDKIRKRRGEISRKSYKNYRKERNKSNRFSGKIEKQDAHGRPSSAKIIYAPSFFSLFENFSDTNDFFKTLESMLKTYRKVYVDLSRVENIRLEAILVLLATTKKYAKRRRKVSIYGNSPRSGTQAADMFYDSGFQEEFYSTAPHRPVQRQKGKMVQRKGYKVENELAEDLVLEANEALYGIRDYPLGIYQTMVEAMGNTREHANPKEEASEHWWVMLYTEKTQGKAYFVFYDGGIGILGSLRSRLTSWFSAYGIGSADEDILHDIMHGIHRSRTSLPYRGKGLPAMAKAVKRNYMKNLKVLSNQVLAEVDVDKFSRTNDNFPGTLLYWELEKK